MLPQDIQAIRQALPEEMVFPYYPDREAAWLLAQDHADDVSVAAVKAGRFGRFAARALVQPLLAAGGGIIRQRDLLALAHADKAVGMRDLSAAAQGALNHLFAVPWQDYVLSFDQWGTTGTWEWQQISRRGGTLVVQLGFPSDHAELMRQYLGSHDRKKFEDCWHPVRQDGRPTLAWARLDLDTRAGVCLIEEVQSDWLRNADDTASEYEQNSPQSRSARVHRAYARALKQRYAKVWPRVLMLSVLVVARDQFGVRDFWMHQPEPGAILKGIDGLYPPRSLYTDLPRRFGFQAVDDAPVFLTDRISLALTKGGRTTRQRLKKARAQNTPLFWHLAF